MVLSLSASRALHHLLVLALAGGGLACAATPRQPTPTPDERVDLVWPPPPAPARIAWEGSFTLPRDVRLGPGVWRRARRLVFGGPDDSLVQPQGIAAVNDVVYVTDPGRPRGLVYDRGRRRFTSLDATRTRPWEVPTSVAATTDGVLFVADAVGALYRLAPPWHEAVRLDWPGLERPVAVTVDESRGRLYVLDAAHHAMFWGTLEGAYVGRAGERGSAPGQFNFPTHLAVAPDGTILVTDAMNFRVQRLSPDGAPLSAFGKLGDGTGDFAKPKGIAVDETGTVYVVDAMFDVVQLFDTEGRLLLWFGGSGYQPGRFWLPTGIALDAAGRIYVADSYNRRVQIFTRLQEGAS